jgi:hypothetical protein
VEITPTEEEGGEKGKEEKEGEREEGEEREEKEEQFKLKEGWEEKWALKWEAITIKDLLLNKLGKFLNSSPLL